MIVLEPASEDQRQLWHVLFELAQANKHWTLIGARMVELHAARAGRTMSRASRDADALANARHRPNPVRAIAEILEGKEFQLQPPSMFGVAHEYRRGPIEIDVLAPEGLGSRGEDARTTSLPYHTIEVPGGTQALRRTEWVELEVAGRRGTVPSPNLTGAILIKARAVDVVDDRPDDQRRDLALLLSLVEDPRPLRDELSGDERSWLRRRTELDDPDALFWRELGPDLAQRGISAHRYLSAS